MVNSLESHSTVKRMKYNSVQQHINECMISECIYMNLRTLMLNEKSQLQKYIFSMISFLYSLKPSKTK